MLGDIKYKSRFTHGRSCSHQNQVRRLHTGSSVIKIDKACCNTCYISLIFGCLLDLIHGIHNDLPDRNIVPRISFLNQFKDSFFRVFKNHFQILFTGIAGVCYLLI